MKTPSNPYYDDNLMMELPSERNYIDLIIIAGVIIIAMIIISKTMG